MHNNLRLERITPRLAEKYLLQNKANRKLREGHAEKMADDMKHGRWTECAAPIWFYDDEDIADGQHRLWAVVEAGVPQEFFVGRGLPREAGLNIDTGLTRSVVDNARISGADTDLSNELVALARTIEEGDRQKSAYSNSKRLQLVELHREAAKWTCAHGPRGRSIRNTVTLGAVARAWYHEEDKDKLERFCAILTNGMAFGEHESAAIALRNYLLSKNATGMGVRMQFRDSFLKAMNAIHYFMRGKKLMVIKGVKDEAYPLPKRKK